MSIRHRRLIVLLIALTVIGTGRVRATPTPRPTPSPTSEGGMALITSPGDGAVIFGVASIVGTATSPALSSYQVQWLASADPRAQWQGIVGPISQQVSGAILGQWDTTRVADGAYQIRLRLTLRGGTTIDAYVQHVTVSNQQPTPLPAAAAAPSPTLPPTVGPSPTALIQQPPTATINPTFAAFVVNANPPGNASQFGIDLSGVPIGGAVIGGVGSTVSLFVLGTGYHWLTLQRRMRRKRRRSVR